MKELAARIYAHLKRFEADPVINAERPNGSGVPYFRANAYYPGGARIGVVYVSYQGARSLTRDEAEAYLAWLDAGHVGTHFQQQRTAQAATS